MDKKDPDRSKRKFESGFQRRSKKQQLDLQKAGSDPRQRKLFASGLTGLSKPSESSTSDSGTSSFVETVTQQILKPTSQLTSEHHKEDLSSPIAEQLKSAPLESILCSNFYFKV